MKTCKECDSNMQTIFSIQFSVMKGVNFVQKNKMMFFVIFFSYQNPSLFDILIMFISSLFDINHAVLNNYT